MPPGRTGLCALLAGVTLAAPVVPGSAVAQADLETRAVDVAVNAALGGLVSWTHAALTGRPRARAAARGAAGGVLMSAGRQVVAARFTGSPYLGRHLSLVGIGIANTAVSDTFLYPVPLGPVTVWWPPRGGRVRARINVIETGVLVHYATSARTRLDVDATLATGVPVFTRWGDIDGKASAGFATSRLVVLSTSDPEPLVTRAHEVIHVLQEDETVYLVSSPMEAAVISRLPHGNQVLQYAELGLVAGGVARLTSLLGYCRDPAEVEAFALTEGPGWRAFYCEPQREMQ